MTATDSSRYVLHAQLLREKVESFDHYPYSLPAIRHLDTLSFHPKVTYIIGENGSGKSTLLEGIATAYGFNPEGGTKNFTFATRESHSSLHSCLRLAKTFTAPKDGFFLRAESFYNVATNIDELDEAPGFGPPIKDAYGGVSLHHQSHGESFFALMLNRFGGQGLYILDEPEAALSPTRQMAMLTRMHQLIGDHSQYIIATHSPIVLAYPDAQIYVLDDDGIHTRDYEDTEHYQVTKQFLGNRERLLALLLG